MAVFENFRCVYVSYKNAPVAVRERLSLNALESDSLIAEISQYSQISDILVVSTCNRTEVYYTAPQSYDHAIIHAILRHKELAEIGGWEAYFCTTEGHYEAVKRLYRVAMGLEAQIVGDIQIINQVKQAYQRSADQQVAGAFLHRLLHSIFFTNKRVFQETDFRSGAASTSYAAVELIEEIALSLPSPRILLVGVGEIGTDVARNLHSVGFRNLHICNRTLAKAQVLATEIGAEVADFGHLEAAIAAADIIISSVAMPQPIITKARLGNAPLLSFKYFIDLAVPRSVSVDLEEINGALVYNIDQINNRVNEALTRRLAAIPAVERIIEQSLAEFHEWAKEMEISPTLQKLKSALDQIRQEELARYTKKVSPEALEMLEQATRNMMQKIIKLPALQLKAACKRGEADTLIEVLNDLFNLEKVAAEKSS